MPKTKLQRMVFGIMMAFAMVYGMEVYNSFLRNREITLSSFFVPINEILTLILIVMCLQSFIGGPFARKAAFKIADPKRHKPAVITLTVSFFMVICLCPLMSLVATLMFKGVDSKVFFKWINTVGYNFPMALFWQIAIAGPLVRYLFRKIFAKQLVQQSCSPE